MKSRDNIFQVVRKKRTSAYPDCGWMRMVSRRKNVECYKCGVQDMTLAKVDFATYVSWSEKERQEYASAWMYIHNKGKTKRN
jgi:hypothetical protein